MECRVAFSNNSFQADTWKKYRIDWWFQNIQVEMIIDTHHCRLSCYHRMDQTNSSKERTFRMQIISSHNIECDSQGSGREIATIGEFVKNMGSYKRRKSYSVQLLIVCISFFLLPF